MNTTHATMVGTACALLVGCSPTRPDPHTTPTSGDPAPTTSPAPDSMEELLEAIAAGERPAGDLEVTYDDMHGMHGGETITLHGDGTVEARRRDPPDSPQTEHTLQVSPEQVLEVVALVVDIEGWEQQVPERVMVPDESTARLGLRGAGLHAGTWEFYNDLEGLGRLVRVKRALEALAFPAP